MAEKSKKCTTKKKEPLVKIDFTLEAPEAGEVFLAGSFTGWNPAVHPMKKSKKGLWKLKLGLATGRHEYRYIVDSQWVTDPCCSETVDNGHGERNSVVHVTD
jgi:1,4-alpha-glucan branching enzyme